MADISVDDIRTNLQALVDSCDKVQESHIGHTFQFNGYPAVKIWLQLVTNLLLDTGKTHDRKWGFALEVVQDASAKSREQAEIDFELAIEQILNAIQNDWTLTDVADLALAGTVRPLFRDTGNGIQVSAIIPVEVTVYADA